MKDVKQLTRARAQREIANTNDPKVIGQFLAHGNSHIKNYAAHKLEQVRLEADRAAVEREQKERERKDRKNAAARKRRAEAKKAKEAAEAKENVA